MMGSFLQARKIIQQERIKVYFRMDECIVVCEPCLPVFMLDCESLLLNALDQDIRHNQNMERNRFSNNDGLMCHVNLK